MIESAKRRPRRPSREGQTRMHRHFLAGAGLIAGLLTVAPGRVAALAAADAAPLAQVNGEAIGLADLEAELRDLQPGASAPAPAAVLRRLIQNRLLEQEGYRIGAETEPGVHNQVQDLLRLRSVVALMDSVSAEAGRAGKAALDSLMNQERELRRYAHILVADAATARALRDSLSAGVPFADLARRHSLDGNAARGGELGWAGAGAYVPAFEAAAAPLAIGEIAGPVETQFGWHLITLLESRRETAGQSPAMREAMQTAREREQRMAAVRAYVAGLRERYAVAVDDSLLARLDFGSEDPAVQTALRESDAVLAVLPTGRLTVQGLYRQTIFKYFHGLAGRAEAAQLAGEVFREWVDEALLSYEAKQAGLQERPALQAEAKALERALLREEVLKLLLLSVQAAPSEDELAAYYAANPARFAPPPRVKLRSLAFADEAAAAAFRARVEQGVQFGWLAAREPAGLPAPAPFSEEWLEPAALGLADAALAEGALLGPLPREERWVVAQVQQRERPTPPSFAECREEVLAAHQRERQQEAVRRGLAQLEAAATVTIAPDAESRVAALLAERAASAETQASGGQSR